MGTRHLIEVMIDGKVKVAQYGQWDGYPSGQGKEIAKFLKYHYCDYTFSRALRACRFLTKAEIDALGSQWKEKMPWLSRDLGAKILFIVQAFDGVPLIDASDSKKDTWIEFCYLIDMDKSTITMSSSHSDVGLVTLPLAEWTEEKMDELQKKFNGDE